MRYICVQFIFSCLEIPEVSQAKYKLLQVYPPPYKPQVAKWYWIVYKIIFFLVDGLSSNKSFTVIVFIVLEHFYDSAIVENGRVEDFSV